MEVGSRINFIVFCALLCVISVLISLYSPLKILIPPSSFTFGSHVAIFIAMFISPWAALAVSLGTAAGFYFAGYPAVIIFRAVSHLTFAQLGALYLSERPHVLEKWSRALVFSFFIACLHAFTETAVVIPYYFDETVDVISHTQGFFESVLLYVGVGTIIHSMVDFALSLFIWKIYLKIYKSQKKQQGA